MELMTSVTDDVMTLKISGRFDFSGHNALRQAYEGTHHIRYVIDLAGTEYMDSAALGMLLQLREFAGGTMEAVRIINASPTIRKVLEVANFDRLMEVI